MGVQTKMHTRRRSSAVAAVTGLVAAISAVSPRIGHDRHRSPAWGRNAVTLLFTALIALVLLGAGLLAPTAQAGEASQLSAGTLTPERALVDLNRWRARAGIPPVESLDPDMSEGCRLHNRYMKRHGIGHEEKESSPLFTALGAEAGGSSVLSSGEFLPRPAWEDAVYHRSSLLYPRLRVTGYSASFGYTCMGVFGYGGTASETDEIQLYPWPFDGQTKVPLRFRSNESPNPYDEAPGAKQLGYLISVAVNGPWKYGPEYGTGTTVEAASLTAASGDRVPVAISDRESRHGGHMNGGFGIFPKRSLKPGTWYTVRASGVVRAALKGNRRSYENLPFSKTWRFRTVEAPPRTYGPRLRLGKRTSGKKWLRLKLRHSPLLKGQTARIIVGKIGLRRCGTRLCKRGPRKVTGRFSLKLGNGVTTFRVPAVRSRYVIRTIKAATPRVKLTGKRTVVAGRTGTRRFRTVR